MLSLPLKFEVIGKELKERIYSPSKSNDLCLPYPISDGIEYDSVNLGVVDHMGSSYALSQSLVFLLKTGILTMFNYIYSYGSANRQESVCIIKDNQPLLSLEDIWFLKSKFDRL